MSKILIRQSWSETAHLTEKMRNDLLKDMRPHQRRARTEGIPQVGAGAVYPISEDLITCAPFQIPNEWPRGYSLDVGWNRTAALWGAVDRATDVLYIYSEHYLAEAPPAVHAQAIRGRGAYLRGVVDPASRGRSQDDGEQLFTKYTNPIEAGGQGLNLSLANNEVETGIDSVWQRMVSARLRVFSSCPNFFYEFRLYKRDDKGKVVKSNDHLMDCLRYMCNGGIDTFVPALPVFRKNSTALHQADFNMFAYMEQHAQK